MRYIWAAAGPRQWNVERGRYRLGKEEEKMLMTIRQLRVRYGNQVALDIGKPIAFEKGERIGVIGSKGA